MFQKEVQMALQKGGFLSPASEMPDMSSGNYKNQRHPHISKCLSQVQVIVLEGVIKNVIEFQFLGSLKA